ncbi:DEAD/DEAH box helicase (plasmid) [Morganella morganii]|uniref:Type I restriction enzyme endonuclease subunit n=1 Tax=Morganella morganii TaxID=582 RepID=A0A433ZQU7_MORMO|nr:type I restriction endonuclease subunit R [Morganella morganii]RUT64497.1 DEAD/DEAH box helicase [Morganella morganii]
MSRYNVIAENPLSTVVAEYLPVKQNAQGYQSEAALENAFIELLQEQAYEQVHIHDEAALIANLRLQLSELNQYRFSDDEWQRFFDQELARPNATIEDKAAIMQENHVLLLKREDGTTKNIYLMDKTDIHNNRLQVTNQYATEGGNFDNRYDVTVLVNGLPLVHVELKRRGVAIREAFNQINRYQRDSFWADSGLFEYVQLFVISNGTYTKYYSNTTRFSHIKEQQPGKKRAGNKTSNSFEFTSWWADAKNRAITDLMDFGKTFFAKHTLLNVLTRYCVLTSDRLLLVMRPYQVVATESILSKLTIAHNYKQLGSRDAGGYIWHTTGSGKTLTSFKTAQLASRLPFVDKVLFVVDRKDLDYQTMKEYDRFQKGAANSNTSTRVLRRQMEDPACRIIITTIQKLDRFVKKNSGHAVFSDNVVMIFDECHRSQFGEMQAAIKKAFKKYALFGFTGTPIFALNARSGGNYKEKTTEDLFGAKLHTYTIVDAINDKNVLPFRVDYIKTMKARADISDRKVSAINTESALMAPERIQKVTQYILEHFNQKTSRQEPAYRYSVLLNVEESASQRDRKKVVEKKTERHIRGFNALFAVSSIDAAKAYYLEFKRQQQGLPEDRRLRVATIFSYGANEEERDGDGIADENPEDISGLNAPTRAFLENAISDYNGYFDTTYDTRADRFQNYYKDVSLRMKNRDIDLLIVVNMFLTGFDATTLNTLWVDKNLRMHGLIQAFSRTNRILNSIKTFGNIVCFRNLENDTNDALRLFGNREARSVVLLRPFADYYYGTDEEGKHQSGYVEMVAELRERFPPGELIVGEQEQKDFINLYGKLLRMTNILNAFDEFDGKQLLTVRDIQDYAGQYQDTRAALLSHRQQDKADIIDDVVFELELLKQQEINIDYILMLIQHYREQNREVKTEINRAVNASVALRSKKDLITAFIDKLTPETRVEQAWPSFIQAEEAKELESLIEAEKLDSKKTRQLVSEAYLRGSIPETGTAISGLLPPASRFSKGGNRKEQRRTVIEQLKRHLERFLGMVSH